MLRTLYKHFLNSYIEYTYHYQKKEKRKSKFQKQQKLEVLNTGQFCTNKDRFVNSRTKGIASRLPKKYWFGVKKKLLKLLKITLSKHRIQTSHLEHYRWDQSEDHPLCRPSTAILFHVDQILQTPIWTV